MFSFCASDGSHAGASPMNRGSKFSEIAFVRMLEVSSGVDANSTASHSARLLNSLTSLIVL